MAETNNNTTADDNNKSIRKENKKAKELLQEKDIKMENGQSYATGSGAFASFFNSLVDEVQQKAQKEADKPRYRFLDTTKTKYLDLVSNSEVLLEIRKLNDKLQDLNYTVEVFEDLDCKDVTNGSRYFIRISNLNGVYVNIDMLDYQDKIKDFMFNEQDYIENELSKIVGYTNNETKEVASNVVDYLAHIMYFRDLYILTYKRIGWEFYNWERKRWIFKYDQVDAGDALFFKGRLSKSLAEGLEAVEDADDIKEYEWVLHTKSLMNNHTYVSLILAAGISGLVRQLLPYTKENNININIVGKPASGKSTICHYLLSFFGNPAKLEGSFTDTDNKMEENRGKRPVLPYVLDERMLKIATESEKHKEQTVLMDIFREYEGKVKERLGKQYEETSGERTYGPIISSSVDSMMEYVLKADKDLGQYRRFIEFNIGRANDHMLFSNSEESKTTEAIAYKNYGFGIRLIVRYMLEILNETIEDSENGREYIDSEPTFIRNWFNSIDGIINKKLESREREEREKCAKIGKECRAVGLTSSSKRFALIVLSYQILRETLVRYEEYNLGNANDEHVENAEELLELRKRYENIDEIEDKTSEIIQILIDNLVDKMNRIRRNPAEKMNEQYNYFLKHREHFVEGTKFEKADLENLLNLKGDKLGFCIIDETERKIKIYTIYEYALPQFWEMLDIPEPEIIKKYIKEIINNKKEGKAAISYGVENYGTVSIAITGYNNTNKAISSGNQKYHELEFQYTDLKKDEV